jgi:hypothetical protein
MGKRKWMVLHVNSRRLLQDLGSVTLLSCGLLAFQFALHRYLSGMAHPLPLMASFIFVLALACFYEWKTAGWSRHAVAMWAVQAWVFVLAALGAPLMRGWLIDALHQVNSMPEAAALFGAEYRNALATPVVGYGGCFTLGLALSRWLALSPLRAAVVHLVLLPTERTSRCQHCGRTG